MQARYYDPVIGRFYSNDPVDILEHLQRGNKAENGFNRYTYGNNNPYKYVDPDGEFGVFGAVLGAAMEVFSQVSTSMGEGNSFSDSMANLNLGKVAGAAALGSVGGVGGNLLKATARGRMTAGVGSSRVSLELSSATERAAVGLKGATLAGSAGAATAGMRGNDMSNAGAAKVVDGLTKPVPVGSIVNAAIENPEVVNEAIYKAKELMDKPKEPIKD